MFETTRRSRWVRAGVLLGALAAALPGLAGEPAKGPDVGPTRNPPIVPGFERALHGPKADPVLGGELLLGELNCLSCHEAEKTATLRLLNKQAPILDTVGNRVKTGYLRAFLAGPRHAKPGTTMPDLFATLPEAERTESVEALVHFLASTGSVSETNPDRKVMDRGKKLFHQVGCVACHGPRDKNEPPLATSVPLGNLASKYTVASLTAFLQDPFKVRPSGRMPALNLTAAEPSDLAHYLLRDLQVDEQPNLAFDYYEGSWSSLPDFETLKPAASGLSIGFDLGQARRANDYALRFQGVLQIQGAGDYLFHLTSDDGSRLWIDGKLVVDNDGIHAPETKSGSALLTKGDHQLVVAVFNGGNEAELEVEYEHGRLQRQPIAPALVLPASAPAPAKKKAGRVENPELFRVDPQRVEKGRDLFATVGCASCHQLREGNQRISSRLTAPPLAKLKTEEGCLAAAPKAGHSMYDLNAPQREALAAALAALARPDPPPVSQKETVARAMAAFNCYACHQRDGVGGVEAARDSFFETTQKEMGDEGRLPPGLDGVGAKLESAYLKHLFSAGAKDRSYMLTRMPRFGEANVGHLVAAFEALDTIEPVATPDFALPPRRVKSAGRFLAGGEAFGCVKCHTFKGIPSEGVQAIDMTVMTRRLRRDWFHRYLLDPQKFRPGTRMPGAWPMGQSLLPKVLDGDSTKQIEAIWRFLSDGTNAAEPFGLGRNPIPLVAGNEPILYRNFLAGAGPRGIGVGYPEKANLAFDANAMRIALIWQGAFLDASRHWNGRGEGFQAPLGDNVVSLPNGPSFAILASGTEPWPSGLARSLGFSFRGYRLDPKQRPTFLYDFGPVHVTDFPTAKKGEGQEPATLRRILALEAGAPVPNLWFRAMAADKIEAAGDGWFTINGEWRMRITAAASPIVRASGGKSELLVPIDLNGKPATIVQDFVW